jgi:hypothetical protein
MEKNFFGYEDASMRPQTPAAVAFPQRCGLRDKDHCGERNERLAERDKDHLRRASRSGPVIPKQASHQGTFRMDGTKYTCNGMGLFQAGINPQLQR